MVAPRRSLQQKNQFVLTLLDVTSPVNYSRQLELKINKYQELKDEKVNTKLKGKIKQ
jgi:hypothetical protein